MPIKAGLFILIASALVICSLTPIEQSCTPSRFKDFEPFLTFRDLEDTGLVGFKILYNPENPRKLDRCKKLWRK